jgi:hypothetical protein
MNARLPFLRLRAGPVAWGPIGSSATKRHTSVPRTWRRSFKAPLSVLVGALVMFASGAAGAQHWAKCSSNGGTSELDHNIREHHVQMFRMMDKFKHIWYLQGPLPKSFDGPFGLDELNTRLGARSDAQEVGVLFHSYSELDNRLCVSLIRGTGEIKRATRMVQPSEFDAMRPSLLWALGAQPPGSIRDQRTIRKISQDLVPDSIVNAAQAWGLARMLVVPIFDLGEIPYAALELADGRMLMDVVKVTIAPGFFVFRDPPRVPTGSLEGSFVAAYAGGSGPDYAVQSTVTGAAAVRASLGAKAPVFSDSTDSVARLDGGRFVFIAAHGVSNTTDPVDGGMVKLADGPWNGRRVAGLRDQGGLMHHPIVILSACESGTGKMFEVGAIGLSRAWYYAGASSVVSSLWRVGELSAMELMKAFVEKAKTMPVDDALWAAMKSMREIGNRNKDPVDWAAFSIFGSLPVQ